MRDLSSAVSCLERSIDARLRFVTFPQDEWISLRTKNSIERLNKEFKRRTRSMETIVPLLAGLSSPGFYLFKNGITLEIKP